MRELKCVKIKMNNPYKINREGKEELMIEIAEEMTEEELDEFLKKWGYTK